MGQNVVVITAGSGAWEVDPTLAQMTKQRTMDSGIGCDVVSMARPPLHNIPLFITKTRSYDATASTPSSASAASFSRLPPTSTSSASPVLLRNTHVNVGYSMPHWIHCSFFGHISGDSVSSSNKGTRVLNGGTNSDTKNLFNATTAAASFGAPALSISSAAAASITRQVASDFPTLSHGANFISGYAAGGKAVAEQHQQQLELSAPAAFELGLGQNNGSVLRWLGRFGCGAGGNINTNSSSTHATTDAGVSIASLASSTSRAAGEVPSLPASVSNFNLGTATCTDKSSHWEPQPLPTMFSLYAPRLGPLRPSIPPSLLGKLKLFLFINYCFNSILLRCQSQAANLFSHVSPF